jgi:RNA polymerase sigma factor (sigma-70 family)
MNNDDKQKLSDEELMGLYQASDYYAFEILYKRHSGRLYEYLKSKVGMETAQELLQDTFARIHKSREKYNPQYPFLPWFFTVARNILFDYFKRAETQTKQNSIVQDSYELSSESAFAEFGSIDQLDSALAILPEAQKRALKLRYLDDWSFEKIAKEFDTTPQNVRQLISRGLRKVKSAFDKKEIDQ